MNFPLNIRCQYHSTVSPPVALGSSLPEVPHTLVGTSIRDNFSAVKVYNATEDHT
jgi:hypothetical protein